MKLIRKNLRTGALPFSPLCRCRQAGSRAPLAGGLRELPFRCLPAAFLPRALFGVGGVILRLPLRRSAKRTEQGCEPRYACGSVIRLSRCARATLGDCPTPYSCGEGRFVPCHGENSRKIHIRRILPSTQREFQGILASGFRKKRANLHTKFTFAVLSLLYSRWSAKKLLPINVILRSV
jgi:hypothetical protein